VYGLCDGDECRNAQQRAINIYQRIVLVYFGKSVGIERMHPRNNAWVYTEFSRVSADRAAKLNIFYTVLIG